MSEAEGTFNEDPNDFKKRVNSHPYVQKNRLSVVDKDTYNTLKRLVFVLAGFFAIFLYLVYGGYLQDNIAMTCPNITCNMDCPECPECSNVCDVNFPSSLTININNTSLNNSNGSSGG